ncbi:MAG: ABC transporter permease [Chelatococcus sp.]|jgi:peptide/nickel transport system permease protein|uniref:ABC transporter permease n=1 Tax=unclassified Chelatococcus TaxID=2638111 RepID=UPI001BD0B349|nr:MULTISPECIES: ABC transporter permease [unclassified Chelatococcus]CAH1656394.1 Oligopeptide transport system permease protein AppC [Hyphomicrobiales bacterium]MBS7740527.1 ABC transporter permease [Chelatococcus sp. HY11]MBX3538056.1 ABC transporter permease [Chelatococcus sp.]MBX3544689.1 ABC transporter permease [Chelatococcus sp.]MCO5078230.1 ABC transporter permease [Chelatococcus sp.]
MSALRRFLRNATAVIGLLAFLGILAFALLAPVIYPGNPLAIAGAPLRPPGSPNLIAGSDMLGRNVAAGLAYGARVSLTIGLLSALLAIVIGAVLGALAGYFGRWIDDAIMRFTEFFQIIPSFILLMVLIALMRPSVTATICGIALISWPQVARIVRAEFLVLRRAEFVEAARVQGFSTAHIITREIAPNALSPVIVIGSILVANAILTESALSFLGLGDPNLISWGYMIAASRSAMRLAWWTTVMPGLCIALTVLALNLVGDGLNDAFNRRLGEGGRA